MNKNSKYQYQEHLPMAKDCTRCGDFDICGGLRVEASINSCLDLCSCNVKKSANGSVCKCDPVYFVQRKREVAGWGLKVPNVAAQRSPSLPLFVPMVYDRSRRSLPFIYDAVAVPLSCVLSKRTGDLLVQTRDELCSKFLVSSSAKIVLGGVHHDPTLEAYWSIARARDVASQLQRLNLDLLTTPNFSVFADVQRWDNFHNMKRIAICWHELAAAGNPAALYINARTPSDYQRWSDFLNEHDEIDAIAFEFQTGTASPKRAVDHVKWLEMLSGRVKRRLTIICFGGWAHLRALLRSFKSVTHISATPYMRMCNYKKLVSWSGARPTLRYAATDMSPDELLRYNSSVYSQVLSKATSAAA